MHNATTITTGSANQRPNTSFIRLWVDVTFRGVENSYCKCRIQSTVINKKQPKTLFLRKAKRVSLLFYYIFYFPMEEPFQPYTVIKTRGWIIQSSIILSTLITFIAIDIYYSISDCKKIRNYKLQFSPACTEQRCCNG